MYRGPGFKQFHPVFGSMPGHREICDKWDARKYSYGSDQTRTILGIRNRATGQQLSSTNISTDPTEWKSSKDGRDLPNINREQEQCWLEQILTVFPQAQHDFVRKLLRERHSIHVGFLASSRAADADVPGDVIAQIAEMESFPKQKDLKRKHSLGAGDNEDKTITWDRGVLKNQTYYREALILLAAEFTRIPTHFINKILREKDTLYDAFSFLAYTENTYYNSPRRPYPRARLGRVMLEKKYQRTDTELRESRQYISVVNEFQAARQQQHREETRQKRKKADEEAEANNFTLHQLQGSLIECQCCFNEAPINRVVNCENDQAHFFCNTCINMRANEQLGALKHEMLCMDISGCRAELSKEALARTLPVKISDKLAEIQQLAEIKAAGLDGLEQCPFCEFQAICEPVEVDSLFECLNPECEKVSCRKCHEESHVPRSCEEAKKDKGLSAARHAIEEARSEAMIRSCPRCKVKIIKSAGCNKLICSNCKAVMCYVCKKDITGRNYEHFDTRATACPIQDRPAEDRHQHEADDAETAAIAAAKARDADLNEDDLRIEAHLNQRPAGQWEEPGYRELHGLQAGYPLAVPPQLQHPVFVSQPRVVPLIGQEGAPTARSHNELHVPYQQDRLGGMLGYQQQQSHRLQPFLRAAHVPHMPYPPRPNYAVVPGLGHARQHFQDTYPRLAVDGGSAQPARTALRSGVDGMLAARRQDIPQRDLLLPLQNDIVHNNNNDPLRRDQDIFRT